MIYTVQLFLQEQKLKSYQFIIQPCLKAEHSFTHMSRGPALWTLWQINTAFERLIIKNLILFFHSQVLVSGFLDFYFGRNVRMLTASLISQQETLILHLDVFAFALQKLKESNWVYSTAEQSFLKIHLGMCRSDALWWVMM